MTPAFRILANDKDITAKVRDRLLTLTISDEAGWKADQCELSLDDRGGALAMPEIGTELSVEIGYEETGLQRMGLFRVDEIDLGLDPETLTVSATAVNMSATLKSRKTRAWDDVDLGGIVATIAADHGLKTHVSPSLASLRYEHLDQTNESDFHFLTRLSRDHDAAATVKADKIMYIRRGEAKSASGKTVQPITIRRGDLTGGNVILAERGRYKSVRASWHDVQAGERQTFTAGKGAPVFEMRHVYQSKASAKRAAISKLAALERSSDTATLPMTGNTAMLAEVPLMIEGVREKVDGAWLITSARHELTNSGYSVTVECEASETMASE